MTGGERAPGDVAGRPPKECIVTNGHQTGISGRQRLRRGGGPRRADCVRSAGDGPTPGTGSATCRICGRVANPTYDGDPPRNWCAEIVDGLDGPGVAWLCSDCSGRHIRSIEAQLDRGCWWES
jgi:hypothetical protein